MFLLFIIFLNQSKELPEVEAKKIRLMMKNAEMKKQLQDIENKILKSLSDSSGDILDNEELINTLAASKETVYFEEGDVVL